MLIESLSAEVDLPLKIKNVASNYPSSFELLCLNIRYPANLNQNRLEVDNRKAFYNLNMVLLFLNILFYHSVATLFSVGDAIIDVQTISSGRVATATG
jgi:hypothetical protein